MKRLSALSLFAPLPAYAHAGEHKPDFAANLVHFLTEPDHLIMLFSAAALVGLVVYLCKAGKV